MAEAFRVEGAGDAGRLPLTLNVLVFCAGVGSLATEIAAARLLAPYYGASTVVWANVIGLVLASLSLGYWLGGRLADRRPEPRLLGLIVVGAAMLIVAVTFLSRPLLELSVEGLDQLSTGAVIGSFFAVLLLFAPPVTLLGMVAPFAIRLSLDDLSDAGAVAGRLYALSTIGSLLGTFLSALVTIPLIGTQRTLLLSAAVIALPGSLLLGRRWLLAPAVIAVFLAVPPGAIKPQTGLLHEDESLYQYIQVVERDDARRLYLNEGIAVHSVWREDELLTGGVWDTFLVVPSLLGRRPERVAILGNAGGTTARAMGRFYPETRIDGVELDGAVSEAGRRFFGLEDNPRLEVHTADARPFLRRADAEYDLIVVDAYRPPYVPFYLATREFFALARDRLAPGGVIALNVATTPDDHRLAEGIARTLRSEVPQVVTWQPLRFNQIVIGLDEAVPLEELRARAKSGPAELGELSTLLAEGLSESTAEGRVWTDDRAPVEWITDRMIVEYGAGGGRFEEAPLPTAP